MTKPRRMHCQVSIRVDGICKSFALSKPAGLTDQQAAEDLTRLLRMVSHGWQRGERCECHRNGKE